MRRHLQPRDSALPTGRPSRRSRRARERRVLWVGLALSAVLHVLVIGWVGGWLAPAPPSAPPGATAVILEPPRGMRAVAISEVPSSDVAAPDAPTPEEAREDAPRPVAVARTPAAAVPADDRTAADRLAPRVVDPRLWEPMILIPREPTLSDVEARVAAAVELLSDSALAEADRAMRARDWTVTDADGGKWGISPGKLHLGSLTLPLPISFPEEWDPTQGEWYELEAQVDRARLLESFESRVKAIRERRDRERSERLKADNGGGS